MKLLQMVRQVISHISKEWTMSIIHFWATGTKKEVHSIFRNDCRHKIAKDILRHFEGTRKSSTQITVSSTTDPFLSVKAELTFHLSVDRHGSSKQIGEKTHFQTPSTHKEID